MASNILLRMRRNGKRFSELETFSVDFFAFYMMNVIRLPDPDFLAEYEIFGDLKTFSIDFRILKAESSPYFCFRFILPIPRQV